eukprot:2880127-Heterocapsa_arctica.AAC.1
MDKSQSSVPQEASKDDWTQFQPSARISLESIPEEDKGGKPDGLDQPQDPFMGHPDEPLLTGTPGVCHHESS